MAKKKCRCNRCENTYQNLERNPNIALAANFYTGEDTFGMGQYAYPIQPNPPRIIPLNNNGGENEFIYRANSGLDVTRAMARTCTCGSCEQARLNGLV